MNRMSTKRPNAPALSLPPHVLAKTDSTPIIRFGVWSLGAAFSVFIVWAAMVPIASSVVTMGTLVSDGRNKVVQHPTGGVVRGIAVRSGDRVAKGETLLVLDVVKAQAELTRLESRARMLRAARQRLMAQLKSGDGALVDRKTADAGKPRWQLRGMGQLAGLRGSTRSHADNLTTASVDAPDRTIERSEADVFTYGRAQVNEEIATLDAKIATLRRQREGIRARADAISNMLTLSRAERDRLAPLVSSGYVARNRLRDRQRTVLDLQGKLAAQRQDESAIETRIAEIEHERSRVKAADMKASSSELTRIATELAELSDQIVAARQGVDHATLRAPVSGTVTKLAVSTQGGVIGGGDVLAEIVPDAAAIEVTARVAPTDIAHVEPGDAARLTVTAFTWRGDEPLAAEVTGVEADASTDERTGETYFEVTIRPTDAAVSSPAGRQLLADLRAGMQAEVQIRSGDRTFISYLFEPIARSFRRAFRET